MIKKTINNIDSSAGFSLGLGGPLLQILGRTYLSGSALVMGITVIPPVAIEAMGKLFFKASEGGHLKFLRHR